MGGGNRAPAEAAPPNLDVALALAVTAERPTPGPGPLGLFAYGNLRSTR